MCFPGIQLLFADDAKCFRPITNPSDCSLLQDDLIRLLDWSNKWKLHFNISKCALVRFSYGTPISPASSYCMGDQDIVALDCLRDLGVLVSDDLSWSAHYDLLCSRAYKIRGLLRRVFNDVFAIAAKTRLYISLVRSQLTYCSVVWRPHLIKDITTLEKIQRRASKYILSSDYKSRLTSLNMLPLMMQLELYDILLLILLSHSSIHRSHSTSLTLCPSVLAPPDLQLTSNFSFLQPIVQPTV